MNRLKYFSFALALSFVCFQQQSLLAQAEDQNKDQTTEAKGSHQGRGQPQVNKQVQKGTQQGVSSRGDRTHGQSNTAANARQFTKTTARPSNVSNQSAARSQHQQSAHISVQGNRSNQYNGQWIAGNTHADWDRNSIHNWNHHNYRWYDGGWLIIDNDSSPGYAPDGSTVIKVKQSLAQQGYYKGHFSETIGPRTRRAISNYQSDKGLPVTGQIDEPLLGSLGLE